MIRIWLEDMYEAFIWFVSPRAQSRMYEIQLYTWNKLYCICEKIGYKVKEWKAETVVCI